MTANQGLAPVLPILITDDAAAAATPAGPSLNRKATGPPGLLGEKLSTSCVQESVHLALLDMHMPRLNGLETLQLVALSSTQCLPVHPGDGRLR